MNQKISALNLSQRLTSLGLERKYQRLFSVRVKFVLFVLLVGGVLGFGESVMAQSGNLTVYANASATNIAVGDTVQFNVEVSGGIAPYIYEWDFDDVESYKNPQTISNPLHTFNWAGKHYVEVTVTDSAGIPVTEKALLTI